MAHFICIYPNIPYHLVSKNWIPIYQLLPSTSNPSQGVACTTPLFLPSAMMRFGEHCIRFPPSPSQEALAFCPNNGFNWIIRKTSDLDARYLSFIPLFRYHNRGCKNSDINHEVSSLPDIGVALSRAMIRIWNPSNPYHDLSFDNPSPKYWECRARLNGGPQVRWILSLLLLAASAWLCLQHSHNLGTTFWPSPVHDPAVQVDKSGRQKDVLLNN